MGTLPVIAVMGAAFATAMKSTPKSADGADLELVGALESRDRRVLELLHLEVGHVGPHFGLQDWGQTQGNHL